jgi:hypothetical protein
MLGLHRYGSALPDLKAPTTLSDSRRGRRPKRRWGAPLLTTNHPSDVLCLLPRRIKRVRVSIASPFAQLSQNGGRVGIRIDTFEMLLRLYSRYGPSDRSATQGDLCHEASSRLICI